MTPHPDSPTCVLGLASGQLLHLAVTSQTSATAQQAGKISTTDATSFSPAALTFTQLPQQHTAAITSAQLSRDGRMLVSLSKADAHVVVSTLNSDIAQDSTVLAERHLTGALCIAWAHSLTGQSAARLLVGCANTHLVVSLLLSARLDHIIIAQLQQMLLVEYVYAVAII